MESYIRNKIEELLAKEYFCSIKELNAAGTIFTKNPCVTQSYIKMMAYRNAVVVCISKNIFSRVKDLLKDKSRDEIFEFPFVYGQTIHYVPDTDYTPEGIKLRDYDFQILFGEEILSLQGLKGFENSLAFDDAGCTPAKAAYIARHHKKIIGISGAALSSINDLWEIGVDVLPEYRNLGLGAYLVKGITKQLLDRKIIPFYSASVTNIGSQMVAGRCGYIPAWVDTYGTILDGSSAYNDIVKHLIYRYDE